MRADDLAFAHQLADAADEITRANFVPGVRLPHRTKDDGTPVTDTDAAVERALLELARRNRPGDAFIGEEVGRHGSAEREWIVDGIDGTRSFVAGDPLWGTLIALVEGRTPVLGVHSSPAQGSRTWASRGAGAWTSPLERDAATAVRLHVAGAPAGRPPRANLELTWGDHPTRAIVDRLGECVESVPMTTHPGLMVASGDLHLAVHIDGGPWDFAAIMAIVWEAGGRCLDLHGAEVVVPRPPLLYVGSLDPARVAGLLAG